MSWLVLCLFLGLAAGILSGLVGIGGGVVIVPALVMLLGFSQQRAQGTTLALMVLPIGAFAALTYYRQGFVDARVAAYICLGFVIGGYFGARIATALPSASLEKIFGATLLAIALKMLFC